MIMIFNKKMEAKESQNVLHIKGEQYKSAFSLISTVKPNGTRNDKNDFSPNHQNERQLDIINNSRVVGGDGELWQPE